MKTIINQKEKAIQYVVYDYSLLDCLKLTPFALKPINSNHYSIEKQIKKEIITYYITILFNEIAFLKTLRKNKHDTYQILFKTYNFSYEFYCKALKNTNRLLYTTINTNYFKQLYQNQHKPIRFNPLKENLLLILNPNHEPIKIILS